MVPGGEFFCGIEISAEFGQRCGGINFLPEFVVRGWNDLGADFGHHGTVDDFLQPGILHPVEEFLHFRGAVAEHQLVVFLEERLDVGAGIPAAARVGVVIQVAEEVVVGLCFQE